MKREGWLYPKIATFENLHAAWRKARKGKRNSPEVMAFGVDLERNLHAIRRRLEDRTWRPGPYRIFPIRDPKPRLIAAAPFADRVVHHSLVNVLEPVFEPTFIHDLYSNRKGKGADRAARAAQRLARRWPYVLQCDIAKYFPSMDHGVLKALLRRKVKCKDTLRLADAVIDNSNPQPPVHDYHPGDGLLTPFTRRRGLPIGNQTSQFFSNLYLSPLDHFVGEVLGLGGYVRYVDDFLVFGPGKAELWAARKRIADFLHGLRLRLKPGGVQCMPTEAGFRFLGRQVFPGAVLAGRRAVLRFRRKVRRIGREGRARWMGPDRLRAFVMGSVGHLHGADAGNFVRKLLDEAVFS